MKKFKNKILLDQILFKLLILMELNLENGKLVTPKINNNQLSPRFYNINKTNRKAH